MQEYYPWGGEFTTGDPNNCVAVVLLNIDYKPKENIAIYGPLKTENIGIEKIVANVISNPNIRFLIVCGEEIRGHKSGCSLIALNEYGIDDQHRIVNAPGAIPYIENLDDKAIKRFQNQIKIIDLIGEKDTKKIDSEIDKCIKNIPPAYGEPYIAIKIKPQIKITLDDKRVVHSKITISYLGKVKKRGD